MKIRRISVDRVNRSDLVFCNLIGLGTKGLREINPFVTHSVNENAPKYLMIHQNTFQ